MSLIVIIGVTTILITVVILFATGVIRFGKKKKEKKKNNKKHQQNIKDGQPIATSTKNVYNGNYLTPAKFNVGLIHGEKFKPSDACENKVLYPIQALDVDYGSKMPDNCPCMRFIQPP